MTPPGPLNNRVKYGFFSAETKNIIVNGILPMHEEPCMALTYFRLRRSVRANLNF